MRALPELEALAGSLRALWLRKPSLTESGGPGPGLLAFVSAPRAGAGLPAQSSGRSLGKSQAEPRREARMAARAAGCRRPVLPVLTTGRQVGKKGRVEAVSIFSRLLSPRDRLPVLRASHAARSADAEGLARACAPACPQRQARNGIP